MSNTTTASDTTSVIDTTETSTITPTSQSVVTETSTVTSGSDTITSTSESTSETSFTTSSVFITPSTTTVEPTSSSSSIVSSSVASTTPSSVVTSIVTHTPSTNGSPLAPTVVTITSTASEPTPTPETSSSSKTSSTSASATPSTLGAAGEQGGSGGKLSSGGTIAIAVVIPIVVIALLIALGLFCFKKRQRRKNDEQMRQKEMMEYGYNPNNDPALVPAGAAAYTDNASETAEENNGYRGWGNTSSTQRKPSTTMGSGNKGPIGMALSDSSSQPGAYGFNGASPSGHISEPLSGDTLHGATSPVDGLAAGAAGGAAAGALAGRRHSKSDINRGPSNASSAYSNGHPISDTSEEPVPGPYYHEEVPYNIYNEASHHQGPYGDGTYGARNGGGGAPQPVIQNVGARRDTRIERAPTFPQGPGGPTIAQNF